MALPMVRHADLADPALVPELRAHKREPIGFSAACVARGIRFPTAAQFKGDARAFGLQLADDAPESLLRFIVQGLLTVTRS